jgi:hypothetical protein
MDSVTRVSAHNEKKEMAPVNCTSPLDENLLPITLKYRPTVKAENKLNSTRFPLASPGKEFTYLGRVDRLLPWKQHITNKSFDDALPHAATT